MYIPYYPQLDYKFPQVVYNILLYITYLGIALHTIGTQEISVY